MQGLGGGVQNHTLSTSSEMPKRTMTGSYFSNVLFFAVCFDSITYGHLRDVSRSGSIL